MSDTAIRIRNYHLDGYGHVNNARYLEFLEEARWHFFERHNLLAGLGGISILVARADIRYLRPATEGDTLLIRSRIRALPRQSRPSRSWAGGAAGGVEQNRAGQSLRPRRLQSQPSRD